ncbi:regulator of G-protein signaling protein-like [Lacerta agilis]|uniref:regulator of G-protein signaling protein-like n=1 Tax=Lacerta agilis TaxID=80427 RepID=UPI00141A0BCB|nr:regulator of G-protein signaling protein-like [Lacerta agilis]
MNRMKLIAKKHLTVLMQNEIFADFFNTFLNLPVFGQTPVFMHSTRQWYLWPELPCNLVSKHKGLMNWMEKHRLPYFCKTNLCLHYLLCEELLSFIRSPEAAEMLRWIKADQWLLEKCIGGSRGMWRFRAFMQGMAGEELTKFWLATERILGIDETDESQQDLYESLMQVLMATHLQEGSTVVILCNTTIESLLKMTPYHPQHVRTRREILSEMQNVALFKIESYWLPNFYIHCKLEMEKEPACRHLLEQYEERLHRAGLPKQVVSPQTPMSIRQSSSETKSYCSLESKRKVWDHVTGQGYSEGGKHKEGRRKKRSRRSSPGHKKHRHSARHSGRQSARHSASSSPSQADQIRDSAMGISDESPSYKSSPSEFMSSPLANELANAITYNKLRSSTPVVQFPSLLALKTLVKSPMCLDFLPWALTADKCAGRPFREFLLRRDCGLEVHLLDLWHDLEDFLRMMLCSLGEGNILLRHVMGERICELYLTQNSNWHLPLKLTTLRNLQNLLPSGHVIPWVLKAQKEICKILSFLYEDFLEHDDKMFLYYVSGKEKKHSAEEPYEKDENRRLARRITEALHLCQTLAGMRDFELLMGEHWQLMGTQDLGLGGSIFLEAEPVVRKTDYSSMTFEELARLNPKMAVELLSNNFKEFCKKSSSSGVFSRPLSMKRNLHWTRSSLSFMRKGPASRKPLQRPRTLSEVLQNSTHVDYFRQFLKMNNAEALLLFWIAVEELKNEGNPRIQRLQINDCVRTFFFHSIPPEKLLDCDADIIREIPRAANVTVSMLVTAQFFVMKVLEEKWFQLYQGLYPESDLSITAGGRVGRRSSLMKEKMRRYWNILGTFIRTVCKFRKAMSYVVQRKRFEDFLHRELKSEKENIQSSPQNRASFSGMSGRYGAASEDADVLHVRRKLFGRLISVNFLVNDLYFYLEMEKFFYLADSVAVLSSLGLYTEKDIAFLKSKVATINKLFLNSDIPPKLRILHLEGNEGLQTTQARENRTFSSNGLNKAI